MVEVDRALSAASSLDAAVLTAKVGATAAAAKAVLDGLAGLQDSAWRLLEVAGALAAVYLLAKAGLHLARGSAGAAAACFAAALLGCVCRGALRVVQAPPASTGSIVVKPLLPCRHDHVWGMGWWVGSRRKALVYGIQ
jgi:hypothetical protein